MRHVRFTTESERAWRNHQGQLRARDGPWGEWCKTRSAGEAGQTDWISGTVPMIAEESGRFLRFMSFPSVQDVEGYRRLLEVAGCTVMTAEDTGRFAPLSRNGR